MGKTKYKVAMKQNTYFASVGNYSINGSFVFYIREGYYSYSIKYKVKKIVANLP